MTGFLDGKVALITGGGSGIGRAAASIFGRHGARVVIADVNAQAVEAAGRELRAEGTEAFAVEADISREDEVEQMVARVASALGRLDCAFNNAGIGNPRTPTEDLKDADWRSVFAVDLLGAWLCMKHEIALMRATGGGVIVNNASNAGLAAMPLMAPYGAAKAGLINLTKTVAVEYAVHGIRANAICPGVIETGPIKAEKAAGVDYAKLINIPLGRIGQPEEVGELAAWLASPLSSFITGQAISIDGGQTACQ